MLVEKELTNHSESAKFFLEVTNEGKISRIAYDCSKYFLISTLQRDMPQIALALSGMFQHFVDIL